MLKILLALVALILVAVLGFILYLGPGAIYIELDQIIPDVKIQPSEALKIAEPHLAEHATYHWKKDRPLQTHIVRGSTNYFSDWYYIKKTNYPAKTTRYYMFDAVKVHPQTGEVQYSKK